MRNAMGAFALLAIFACVALLTLPAPAQEETTGVKAEGTGLSFGIYSSTLADCGNATCAVMRTYLFPMQNASLAAFCPNATLQKSAIVLIYPSTQSMGNGMAGKVRLALSSVGLSSIEGNISSAISSRRSVIVAPSGAVPEGLAKNAQLLMDEGSRAVVIITSEGKEIDLEGNVFAENGTGKWEAIETVFLEGKDWEAAAREAAIRAVVPAGINKTMFSFAGGNRTFAIETDGAEECRLALFVSGRLERFADSGRIERANGVLSCPDSVVAGKEWRCEFYPDSEAEKGRTLKFTAIAQDENNGKIQIGSVDGKIADGWSGAFYANFSHGGDYLVKVYDQFSRLHAVAYVKVFGLEVKQVNAEGNRYEFYAMLGGAPANGMVEVWIDDGQKQQYPVSNGKLVVFAAPKSGKRVMHFDIAGTGADWTFEAQAGGFAESYAKYAIPGFALLGAVFLLLRAGRKAKYTITFPDSPLIEHDIVEVGWEQIITAWKKSDDARGGCGLPAYPQEMASCLLLGKEVGKRICPDSASVLSVLRKLANQGIFVDCGGIFIPKNDMGGFAPNELGMLRTLHDLMLERGLPFARKKVVRVHGEKLEFAVISGKENVLLGMRQGVARVALFESEGAIRKFLECLSHTEHDDVKIRMALENGVLVFAVAERKGIEQLLP
ncbi:MAG: hypothetical protein NT051_07035 [Candidatus Micrarchaeota archaeon]|nr:hypothetical protein [Candidatus Micrarchaeota archaeon]